MRRYIQANLFKANLLTLHYNYTTTILNGVNGIGDIVDSSAGVVGLIFLQYTIEAQDGSACVP